MTSAALITTKGTVSGAPTHCAKAPPMSGPVPIPPRLAAVLTTSARRID